MIASAKYGQGGDAQAIKRVADTYYGGFKNMFEAHCWPERGDKILPSVQARVADAYGSVRAFEEAHAPSSLEFPMEAIKAAKPNVWLKSFYGFTPGHWGYLGFSDDGRRKGFLSGSKPGVLVAIYAAGQAPKDQRGKVIGILQCSHRIGHAKEFMSPQEWAKKERDPERRDKWNFAVKAVRAWRVTPESWMDVKEFAPIATETGAWEHIGARGEPLERQEALNILKLTLEEQQVYGEAPIIASLSGPAIQLLAPSRAGPVSQAPYTVREAEGPKHLYVLKLKGDTDAFLGEPTFGRVIVKAGFSWNPDTRRDDHNRALPQCAFEWEVIHSGLLAGYEPYPTSQHARAGELAMQAILVKQPGGRSLGGEFFLAEPELVELAWKEGHLAAKAYKK